MHSLHHMRCSSLQHLKNKFHSGKRLVKHALMVHTFLLVPLYMTLILQGHNSRRHMLR